MKKFGKICITILIIIAVILLCAIGYLKLPVLSYYLSSESTFKIPEIHKGFIPQGISLDPNENKFFITGYEKDKSASPIYIVDPTSPQEYSKILMANPDGSAFTGHAGGLSVLDNRLYVAGGEDACIYAFDLSEVYNAPSDSMVSCKDVISLKSEDDDIRVSFTTVYDGALYVGEFYREQNYPTNERHHVQTSGGINHSLLVKLEISDTVATPVMAYSIRDQIQGAAFDENNLYLSSSYGVPFSHFYAYDTSKSEEGKTINVLGNDIPLFVLDSTSLIADKKLAPMSEEIEFYNGRLYTMCESASNKYIFGKLSGASRIYATDMKAFISAGD